MTQMWSMSAGTIFLFRVVRRRKVACLPGIEYLHLDMGGEGEEYGDRLKLSPAQRLVVARGQTGSAGYFSGVR